MALPTAGQAGDPTYISVGPHKITIDPAGTPLICGFTTGDVHMSFGVQSRFVFANEFGTTPVEEEITGVQVGIAFQLLEWTLKTMDIAMNGLYPSKAVANARTLGRSGVQSAQSRGLAILLHPIKEGSSTARDITLRKILLRPTGNVQLSDQGDKIVSVMGTCIIDGSQVDGQLLLQIGESNAGH